MPSWPCIGNRIFYVVQTGAICPAGVGSQDAKSKLREIAEKRAEDVEEVMLHLEKTLACPDPRYGQWKDAEIVMEHAWNMLEHVGTCWNWVQCWCWKDFTMCFFFKVSESISAKPGVPRRQPRMSHQPSATLCKLAKTLMDGGKKKSPMLETLRMGQVRPWKTQTQNVSGIWHRPWGASCRDIFTLCDLKSLQSVRYLQTYHPSRLPNRRGFQIAHVSTICSDAVGRSWTELKNLGSRKNQKKSESIQLWKER